MSFRRYEFDRDASSYYDASYEPDPDAEYVHQNDIPDLDDIKKAFRDIVHKLYSKDELDIAKLDDVINFIADELDIKIPDGNPQIQRIQSNKYLFNLALSCVDRKAI